MRRARIRACDNRKWLTPCALICLVLLLIFLPGKPKSGPGDSSHPRTSQALDPGVVATLPPLPRFAYMISGSKGDVARVRRLLQAVYHPRNYYLVHFDLQASDAERMEFARYMRGVSAFRRFGNVKVVGKADAVTDKGPTVVGCTLHGAAILLKVARDWDWFINLSAADYPLLSQDDLLHIFSYLPRDLNFIEHSSDIGWKEFQMARPIIIDPGLYHSITSNVFWAKEKRSLPAAFKLFLGSPWVGLSRSFLEFCIWGWDSLPRTLLMYYTNFLSSAEGYFHTVACNNKDYQNTTVNHDLHYTQWDKHYPVNLTVNHYDDMVRSGAPFARTFAQDDPVLKKIDDEILKRAEGGFTYGGWCVGDTAHGEDPCLRSGSPDVIKPTLASKRLERLLAEDLLNPQTFRSRQCK
uniref:Uncharacterized protein n=1 Tax=Kalanchoe fedtschenkoi TaxID=63787 RepID=A0A7N0VAY9_KALFE